MKKNEETALATAATAADFGGGGLMVAGKEDKGTNLSKVVLFQGTAEEEAMYGGHKRGVFLDALEIRELGDKIKIMPVFAYAQWSQWEKGQRQPVRTWTDQRSVPKDMLEWTEKDGHRVPPIAQEAINVVCCVDGEEWPYLLVFKRTGLKAFQKTIAPLEARRAQTGKAPGLYELSSIVDKNPDGQPFQRMTARPAGDPSEKLTALALTVFKAQQLFRKRAAEMAEDNEPEVPSGDFDPNA